MNFIYWILVALTIVINASSGSLVQGKIHPPRVRRESGRNLQSPYLLQHPQIGLELPQGHQSDRFARRAIMEVEQKPVMHLIEVKTDESGEMWISIMKQETETVITAPPPPKPGMMGSHAVRQTRRATGPI
ncbi:unnamed protein product [Allacma fusca]|uniref:Uncharacterized protein n=1 Tax=Allacma fusca TaxID=39272 RepID=A0A8J2J9L7_9HEXA|nr:unnamed protein product [Allacma fusca]